MSVIGVNGSSSNDNTTSAPTNELQSSQTANQNSGVIAASVIGSYYQAKIIPPKPPLGLDNLGFTTTLYKTAN